MFGRKPRPTAQESFASLLREVAPVLREAGFKGSGSTMRIVERENHGLVNFQKSRHSTRDEIEFTINLGIAVGGYWQIVCPMDLHPVKPGEADCTLRERIGALLPARRDDWWRIPGTSAGEIASVLRDVAIPWITAHVK